VGELLGHFFDEAGKAVATTVSNRALALAREDIASRRIVAVAGGRIKVRAIKSVLEGRYLKGLITDERTARSLVEETPVG
ncbi:MAG: sugar-binding transcriptional regulator, partial [Mesorhizobium sp.]